MRLGAPTSLPVPRWPRSKRNKCMRATGMRQAAGGQSLGLAMPFPAWVSTRLSYRPYCLPHDVRSCDAVCSAGTRASTSLLSRATRWAGTQAGAATTAGGSVCDARWLASCRLCLHAAAALLVAWQYPTAASLLHAPRGPQFGGQAPGTSQQEREWAWRKFGFQFDVFDKIEASAQPPPAVRTSAAVGPGPPLGPAGRSALACMQLRFPTFMLCAGCRGGGGGAGRSKGRALPRPGVACRACCGRACGCTPALHRRFTYSRCCLSTTGVLATRRSFFCGHCCRSTAAARTRFIRS